MSENLEAAYGEKIKKSDFRVGQFVKIARKLTDEQRKYWTWGDKILEKYIGLNRYIFHEHEIGFMVEGSDYVFPFEMLQIIGLRYVSAPYKPKQKGKLFEYFTGIQIIDDTLTIVNTSSGGHYNIYFDNTAKEINSISFDYNNHIMLINEQPIFVEEAHYLSSTGRRFMEYLASK